MDLKPNLILELDYLRTQLLVKSLDAVIDINLQGKTAAQLTECSDEKLNPFEISCPVEEKQLIPFKGKSDNFDRAVNKGLPDNYNPVDGWWLDRQKEILSFLNPVRFAQLSIEMTKFGPEQNPITEIEALTVLQDEEQNIVGGPSRPDMINDPKIKFRF